MRKVGPRRDVVNSPVQDRQTTNPVGRNEMIYLAAMRAKAVPVVSEPAADGPDRRTRHRERRRDEVFDAAIALFTEQGYDKTTMDEIAERADVARGTVFNHFSRKVEFLNEWAHRRRQRAYAAVHAEHLDDHHVGEIVSRYMTELARLSTTNRREAVALMSAAVSSTNWLAHPDLGVELAKYVQRGKDRGEVFDDVDADQAGLLLATGYFAVLVNWIDDEPEPFDLARKLDDMVHMILRGLAVPAAAPAVVKPKARRTRA